MAELYVYCEALARARPGGRQRGCRITISLLGGSPFEDWPDPWLPGWEKPHLWFADLWL